MQKEFLQEHGIPEPTLTPEQRHQRRLAYRNERTIYRSTCAGSGKPMISLYPLDTSFTVYSQDYWWSDNWDAMDYGRDIDWSRPFFEQFKELQKLVPRLGLINRNAENSEYCNITTDNKNCYLVFGGDICEDCYYAVFSMKCRDTMDVYWVHDSELTYDCVDCLNAYNLRYSQNSTQCRDSAFLYECRNCKDCVGCVNLSGKQYYIFNQPHSKEDYEKKVAEMRLDTWSGVQKMRQEFEAFRLTQPHRATHIVSSENATGEDIVNAKNIQNCFSVHGPSEDAEDCFLLYGPTKDSYSCDHVGHKAERFYEMMGSIDGYNNAFGTFVWSCADSFYCDFTHSSEHLFGCVGLKRKKFCILNKQYSEEDYHATRARLIEHMKATGEWGQFFPIENSPFAYNETVAQDFFPLTKESAPSWRDEELRTPQANNLPDSIQDTTDDILQQSLTCELTGRPYRIIPKELAYYRKLGIPVPRHAPETRHTRRIKSRYLLTLFDRTCAKTGVPIQTPISPDRPEIVWSEEAYREEFLT